MVTIGFIDNDSIVNIFLCFINKEVIPAALLNLSQNLETKMIIWYPAKLIYKQNK
jgi:hypothetical protein